MAWKRSVRIPATAIGSTPTCAGNTAPTADWASSCRFPNTASKGEGQLVLSRLCADGQPRSVAPYRPPVPDNEEQVFRWSATAVEGFGKQDVNSPNAVVQEAVDDPEKGSVGFQFWTAFAVAGVEPDGIG